MMVPETIAFRCVDEVIQAPGGGMGVGKRAMI